MKRIFQSAVLFTGMLFLTSGTVSTYQNVYICNGKSSKKYHYKKNCRGLSNCSTAVQSVSLEEAKKKGRGLCGWED